METIKKSKKVRSSKGATDIIEVGCNIGDETEAVASVRNENWKAFDIALKGYSLAVSAAKGQLAYKKFTGKPDTIPFFEK